MIEHQNITQQVHALKTGPGLKKIIRTSRDLSFSDVLKVQLERETGITFSAHAMDRLNERNMVLGSDEITRLSRAVAKAEEKGAADSLILLNDMAFIVSVKNRTVITVMTGNEMKNNVFTNIDSAVIG